MLHARWAPWSLAILSFLLSGILIGLLLADSVAHTQVKSDSTVQQQSVSGKVVVAAGDIACEPGSAPSALTCRQADTAALVQKINPDAVLTLGDNQYQSGAAAAYAQSYDKSWGAFKDKTYPTPGNHDYGTANAAGYYAYFGPRAGAAGQGYYSVKIGDWLFVALNSEIDTSAKSAQVAWLHQLLTTDHTQCVAAFWHKPRFSTGGHASDATFDALWRELYADNVDLVLNGHSHGYERFVPLNPDGQPDERRGIVEIVSAMGGYGAESLSPPQAITAVRQNHAFGVLKLTLHDSSAQYEFVTIAGAQQFSDSGTVRCH